ncbi:Transcription factor bHLH155 [Zea mays]|uniref:Transcription factor bHLH155 n=1 Tax=Zea mays TaxID=4577 RepID=A0A1D6HQK6_MAIZE|nr:Transcription factor bHLH155 [Zea mays]
MHEILAGMSTHIIQLLQGLCSDGLWRYGVFWSFKSETNGWILTWGDGYVNKMIEDWQMGDLSASPTVRKNQTIPSSWCKKSYPFCPIEAALMRMPSHLYPLGEGIIGKVALTGQHCWISANELCSTAMHKYQEDWQLQFAAGIKTVLLVPVVPHGVLQLGSLDTVFESAVLVALIKDMFHKICDASVSHASLSTGSAYSNNLSLPTATLSINHPDVNLIYSSAQIVNADHHSLTHPFSTSEIPILEDITIGSYRTIPTGWPNGLLGDNGTIGHEYFEGFSLTDMAHWNQENTHGSTIVVNDGAMLSNTSIHSEFHGDVMVMSREEHELFTWRCRLKQEPTSPALPQLNDNSADLYVQLETNNYAELLLDTIIYQTGHTSNIESAPSAESPISCKTQVKKDHSLRVDESPISDIPGRQDLSPISINEGFISCAMTDGRVEINKTIPEECLVENTHRINSAEIKRRCRKVELQRPRPRDRQLIQDRMKGLRELIPNASKCSIDALLDKTIAYMLFLQSVSEKAEKIQNTLEDKESHDETKKQLERCPLRVEELNQPGHLLIELHDSRSFRDSLFACFILIQMLCEDYEVFLEMAHVLKGLKVSILKGVLEYRSDKFCARFVIEGSDGFNQMQILCPLMHLLRRR